jgi:hypothetical protein
VRSRSQSEWHPIPADGTGIGDLISAADSALYLAKARGRDCVIAAGALHAAETPMPGEQR